MTLDLIVTLVRCLRVRRARLGTGVSRPCCLHGPPERRRLNQLATAGGPELALGPMSLVDNIDPRLKRIPGILPKSPKDMSRLRRRLATAGYHAPTSMVVYGVASIAVADCPRPVDMGHLRHAVPSWSWGLPPQSAGCFPASAWRA